MAIKDFEDEINGILKDLIANQSGGFVSDGGVTIVELNTSTMPKALKAATADILEGIARKQTGGSNTSRAPVMVYKQYNLVKVWKNMLTNASNDIAAQASSTGGYIFPNGDRLKGQNVPRHTTDPFGNLVWQQGVYIETLSNTKMVFHIVTAITPGTGSFNTSNFNEQNQIVKEIFEQLLGDVWDKWIDDIRTKHKSAKLEGFKPSQGIYDLGESKDIGFRYSQSKNRGKGGITGPSTFVSLLGSKVVRAHKNLTTTGAYALEEMEASLPQITLPQYPNVVMNSIDLRRAVLSDTVIKARNTRLKNRTKIGGINLPGQNRIYEVALKKNSRESTDLQKVLNKGPRGGYKGTLVKVITDFIKAEVAAGRIAQADQSTSKPFTEDVADSAILAIADKFLPKNAEVVKITKRLKATPTKAHDYKVRKQPKRAGKLSNKRSMTLSRSGAAGASMGASAIRRTQNGKRKDKELSLSKLKYLINRSLGPMIRRNMGRPALENQTGRFSNSAELVRLKHSKKGYVGEYTYQLNPYATFENLGRKQWPQGYNPKPLISKSIRDIAQRHVEAKFTLRRI